MKKILLAASAALFFLASPDAFAQRAPTELPGCQFLSSPGTLADQQTAILNCTQGRLLKVEATPASGTTTVVGGPAADDAAASGNPVPVGGIYNTTQPTYTALDRTQFQTGVRGSLHVALCNDTAAGCVSAIGSNGADDQAGNTTMFISGQNFVFDGTNWDRHRSVLNATDSVGIGVAAAGLMAQCDETAPTATTENQFGNVTRNCATGALKVERDGDLFLNIVLAAPTTTTVKSGAGRFHKLCINKAAATGVITMYDNTAASGTLIGVITQPAALLSSGPVCVEYDLAFGTGLTIVTATAAQDLTVTYR